MADVNKERMTYDSKSLIAAAAEAIKTWTAELSLRLHVHHNKLQDNWLVVKSVGL